ncbi:MAG TPA: D-aminoacyl-tRNA deacylase [Candidatus Omnitrophota bacterium]|nr:D-aminoacyl-tRNA deacylase [Candidatus Omnitrophota bacterium]HPN88285.1 D-aminoacyl-tRNA deacylase [Candidatus Omnitrophota bacterium]
MKIVIQRVKKAQVIVNEKIVGSIGPGALIFLGIGKKDSYQDADYLIQKVMYLRMFEDSHGKMNLSALDVKAEFLVVSQFTLYGNCEKGRRPSFDEAATPEKGQEFYNYFVSQLKKQNFKVQTGEFRAMMEVSLVNDGPVTFVLESREFISKAL